MERDALQAEIDAIEDWAAKARRTHDLVRTHGAVVASITQGRWETGVDYFDLDAVADDCPWRVGSRDPTAIIASVFAPIASDVPTVVRALAEACHSVVARRDAVGGWSLLYYAERRRPNALCMQDPGGSNAHTLFVGGAPCVAPIFGDEARAAGWADVPPQLQAFAAVHDGFGRCSGGFDVGCVWPLARMEPLDTEHPEWLEVRSDSVGNRRLLVRARAAESMTVDWDRDTRELSAAVPLFGWLEQWLPLEILDLSVYDCPDGPYP